MLATLMEVEEKQLGNDKNQHQKMKESVQHWNYFEESSFDFGKYSWGSQIFWVLIILATERTECIEI